MKKSNTFTWSRLLRTMLVLLMVMSMLLCGCANTGGGDDDGGGNGNGANDKVIFGDGDGKMEAQDFVDSLTNLYGAMLSSGGGNQPDNFGYEMDIEVTLGDALMSQLGAAMSQAGLGSDISWFENIGLSVEMNSKGDLIQMIVDAQLNGESIISADMIMDMVGNMAYIGVPEINDQYIGGEVDFDEVNASMMVNMDMLDSYAELMEAMPTDAQLNAVLTNYLNVILENLDDPTTGSTDLSAGGITQGVTTTTYTFNQKNILAIAEKILTTAKSDGDLETVLDGFSEAVNVMGAKQAAQNGYTWYDVDLHGDLMDSIDPALESLQEAKNSAEDMDMAALTVYTNGDQYVGMKLQVNSGYAMQDVLNSYSLKDGKDTALYANLMGAVQITGTGTADGDKVSGEYVLSSYGQTFVYVELQDFDTKALQSGSLKGTVRLRLGDALLDRMGSSLPVSEDTVIELVLDLGGETAKTNVNLYDDEVLLFGFKVTTKMTSGSSIRTPSNYVDAESSSGMSSWLENMEFTSVLNKLKSAGVPSSLIDMLEEGLGNIGVAQPDYGVTTAPAYGY